MPRDSDIPIAFNRAINRDASGCLMVTSSAFRACLAAANHYWTLELCNEWIARHQTGFKDVTDDDADERTYYLRNMARVL
ncbi:hypothetical protein [Escherichia coli]|uniref:hypothetical protein n=1 Tax=Escherichia coli TaxID=562 RepID=UPI001F4BAB9D|nr:hypothetical protein [Escherichia coli]